MQHDGNTVKFRFLW